MTRLEHDLYWGCRLFWLCFEHRAKGFRGHAKGSGFRAYLAQENIPIRKAYRMIRRYRAMRAMWDRINVTNEALQTEAFSHLIPRAEEMLAELESLRRQG